MLDAKFWKKYFLVYDALNLVIPYRNLLEEIVKEAKIKKGELILEAGVGTGNLALLFEQKGGRVVGLDFSKEALDIYKNKNPQAQTVLADLTQKLPFEDGVFDAIVSNNTLYNIPREKRLKTMLEFKRILKPGGKIVLANIHKKFKPVTIYWEALREIKKKFGLRPVFKLFFKMLIPASKIFYHNFIIQKEHKFSKKNLFEFDEQRELLEKSGFTHISETKPVYAKQALLNSAQKP